MHQQLRSHERTPLLGDRQLPRYVEPPEESLPAYEERLAQPPAAFAPHPTDPVLENAPDLAHKIRQRRRRLLWIDPVQPPVLRELGGVTGGLTGLAPMLAAGMLENTPTAVLVVGLLSPFIGIIAGQLAGMYLERQRRAPLSPTLLLEQGVADSSCDARFVCQTLESRGAMRRGGYQEPLHDLLSLTAAPEYTVLSAPQNRRLRYVLWVASYTDQIPRGLWEKLEAATDEDEINRVKALICGEFARLERCAASRQVPQGTVVESAQADDAERSTD